MGIVVKGVMLWGTPIVTVCVTGVAAAYTELPPCVAVTIAVPQPLMVAVFPEMLSTEGALLLKETGKPDEAVA